jgi:hypothetical protein
MKYFLWLLMMAAAAIAVAQTNGVVPTNAVAPLNTTATTNAISKDATNHTFSLSWDHGTFDGKSLQVVGYGHVLITNAQLTLTCERITVDFPAEGEGDHPTNAIAETNLDIVSVDSKGETHHLTCDKGIYSYGVTKGIITKELYTFTGHCLDTSGGKTVTGEPMIWDNIRQTLHIDNFHMVGTNASGFNMNIQK